jgi:hypothetical protein
VLIHSIISWVVGGKLMTVVLFIGAGLWAALSAQFLVQSLTSFAVAVVYLIAIIPSNVPKGMNVVGMAVSLVQGLIFAALFVAGNWFAGDYIDYVSLSATSAVALLVFVVSLVHCASQVPDVLLLARLSAWDTRFVRAAMSKARSERVLLARRYRAAPTMETLYPRKDKSK